MDRTVKTSYTEQRKFSTLPLTYVVPVINLVRVNERDSFFVSLCARGNLKRSADAWSEHDEKVNLVPNRMS